METYLTQITDYLLRQSWQIAVLVAVVAATTAVLKNRSAHVRYLLWLIVLAKCLMPPLVAVPLAVLPDEQLSEPTPVYSHPTRAMTLEEVEVSSSELPAAPQSFSVAVPTAPDRAARLTRHQYPGLVWLAGVVVFILLAGIKALRTNHWLKRRRRPLSTDAQGDIEGLSSALGLNTLPKVWLVEGVSQPFVWGLLHGDVYLPENFVEVSDAEHRRGVLGHELSHVLRSDAAVNLLQIMVQAVFWFHPLIWWMNKKIRFEREKCCDETTIARLGVKARDYSSAIIDTLTRELESTRPIPSLAITGPLKNVEERIRTIMRPGKRFYKNPSLVAVAVLLLIGVLTVPTVLVLTTRAEKGMGQDSYVNERAREKNADQSSSSEPNKKVTCKGWVLDTQGRPIAGAKVSAYEMHFDGLAGNFALYPAGEMTTSEDGAFVFAADQKPERSLRYQCYVVAVKQGLALGWTVWKMREDMESSIELGEPTRLEGVVVDQRGKPIVHAEVRANFRRTLEAVESERRTEWVPGIAPLDELGTHTDGQGRFLFENLPVGLGVDLLVTAKDKAIIFTQKPETREPAFTTGQTDIEVVLPDEARIEGGIVDRKTGKALARTKFAVVASFSGLFYYRFVHTTDDDGRFSIGGLKTGRYHLRNGGFPNTDVDVRAGRTTELTLYRMTREQTHCFHVLLDRGSPAVRQPKQRAVVRFEQNEGVREAGYIDVDGYLRVSLSQSEHRQWQLGKGWFAALIPNADGKSFSREEVFSYDDLTKVWPKNATAQKLEPEEKPSLLMGKPLPDIKDLGAVLPPNETANKTMLICFFDIEQRPSRYLLSRLSEKAQELRTRQVLVVAVDCSEVQGSLDSWMENHRIPFPIGIFQGSVEKSRSVWGVQALPWLILTDRNHVVRSEGFALDELDEKIATAAAK